MTESEVYVLSEQAITDVANQIKGDQWSVKIPDWFPSGQTQKDLTLRQVINYMAYDSAWVPDVLSGKTIAEVGDKYDGDLLGDDPKASFATISQGAQNAVKKFNDLDKIVHLTYGDFSARDYLKHITFYRVLRVYDLSKLIGLETKIPETLARGLYEEIAPEADEWRAMGVMGQEVAVAAEASAQDRLLGLVGRDPAAK